jgi:hypothetical protein
MIRNNMPKSTKHMYVREVVQTMLQSGYELQVVESVCSVKRLAEVCKNPFNSIPVVNMSGRLIGLIPKNFAIVLIEQHAWYKAKVSAEEITHLYKTVSVRECQEELADDERYNSDSDRSMRRSMIQASFAKKRKTLQQVKAIIEEKISDYYS